MANQQNTRVRLQPAAWAGLPTWSRVVLAVYALGFLEGAGAHVTDLALHGIQAYDSFAWPAQTLFYSLVILDAVAVVLSLRAHPAAAPTGVTIMVADLAANWCSNWSAVRADPGILWAPVGLLPMTAFGLFVVSTAWPLRRTLNRDRPALNSRS